MRGGQAQLAAAELPTGLRLRLAAEAVPVHDLPPALKPLSDAQATAALANQLGASWVVLDGYHLGHEHQHELRSAGHHVLAVDDYGHASEYVADLILNQNLGASPSLYAAPA